MTVQDILQGIRTKSTEYTPLAARRIPVWYTRVMTAVCLLFFGYVGVFSLFQTSVFDAKELA